MRGYWFIPYGETVDEDKARLAYVFPLRRYIAERVHAAVAATWPDEAMIPPHIQKARCRSSCAVCTHACLSRPTAGVAPGLAWHGHAGYARDVECHSACCNQEWLAL